VTEEQRAATEKDRAEKEEGVPEGEEEGTAEARERESRDRGGEIRG
jgi:hypothetical protein